jgi:hypothetical protein
MAGYTIDWKGTSGEDDWPGFEMARWETTWVHGLNSSNGRVR